MTTRELNRRIQAAFSRFDGAYEAKQLMAAKKPNLLALRRLELQCFAAVKAGFLAQRAVADDIAAFLRIRLEVGKVSKVVRAALADSYKPSYEYPLEVCAPVLTAKQAARAAKKAA